MHNMYQSVLILHWSFDKGQKTTTDKKEKKSKEKIFRPMQCGTDAAPTVQQNLTKKDAFCLKF